MKKIQETLARAVQKKKKKICYKLPLSGKDTTKDPTKIKNY